MFSLRLVSFLRFNVSVEYSVPVHMFYSFENLVTLDLYLTLGNILLPSIDSVIKVAVHEFKDES